MNNPASNDAPNKTSHAGGLFAAVWRPKGLISASEDELKAISSSGDRLGTWSGFVVVAALFAEAILAAYHLWPLGQRIAGFVINAVIALAVWGEIHFHGRSSDAQNERLRRSNVKLTDALEAARGRRINPEVFWKALEGVPKAPVTVFAPKNDPEAFEVASRISDFLQMVGWSATGPIPIPEGPLPLSDALQLHAQPAGISVVAREIPSDLKALNAFNGLRDAILASLGAVGGGADPNMPEGSIRIVVAPKDTLRTVGYFGEMA